MWCFEFCEVFLWKHWNAGRHTDCSRMFFSPSGTYQSKKKAACYWPQDGSPWLRVKACPMLTPEAHGTNIYSQVNLELLQTWWLKDQRGRKPNILNTHSISAYPSRKHTSYSYTHTIQGHFQGYIKWPSSEHLVRHLFWISITHQLIPNLGTRWHLWKPPLLLSPQPRRSSHFIYGAKGQRITRSVSRELDKHLFKARACVVGQVESNHFRCCMKSEEHSCCLKKLRGSLVNAYLMSEGHCVLHPHSLLFADKDM